MVEATKTILAEQGEHRWVALRADHTVELGWDWVQLHLRQGELLALAQLLEEEVPLAGWQNAPHCTLWLDDTPLHFGWADLLCFRDLLAAARPHLPRQWVRWVDVSLRLEWADDVQETLLFGYN